MTEESLDVKVAAMCDGTSFHSRLRAVARQTIGVDYDCAAVKQLNGLGFAEITCGNVYTLADINFGQTFEVILAGDLIEHLSEPGRMLDQVAGLASETGELIVSTPNSFGLPHFIRYARGLPVDGNDHVLSFHLFTLRNLLLRHGFRMKEAYSCYDRPPRTWNERVRLAVGIPVLKLFPSFGGTLLIVAARPGTHASEVNPDQ
jgi:hypothetical protein